MALAATFLALIGTLYTLASLAALRRFRPRAAPPPPLDPPPVVILKPLHGAEPRLADNLATALAEAAAWPGGARLVAGVARADDPAVAAFANARAAYPGIDARLVIDATRHGANAKVGNLLNMVAATPPGPPDEIIVLADSDMAVRPGYLAELAAALAQPGVGVATCLYAGRADAGAWSRIAAAGVGWQFLPAVAMAVRLGISWPCMGATIALRRATLERIGGFAPFADMLADDHAIGARVRALGLTIAYPPLVLTHAHPEASAGEWARRELRANVTVRVLDPWGYVGSVVTWPVPWALIALALAPGPVAGAVLGAAALARVALAAAVNRIAATRPLPPLAAPVRDMAGFVLYAAALVASRVDWRGTALSLTRHGQDIAER